MKLTKRLNSVVKYVLVFTATWGLQALSAQPLDLYSCYDKAENLSPLKQKETYLASIYELKQGISNSRNLPILSIQGSASYQSDVFSLPFQLPNAETPTIPKEQYTLTLDVYQNIYDGGAVNAQRLLDEAETHLAEAQLETSLYPIKKIINSVYVGIVSLQQNEKILQSLIGELTNQIQRAESGFTHGIVLKSDVQTLQKERLKAQQQSAALALQKKALLQVLGDWTGEEIDPQTEFTLPEVNLAESPYQRPESQVFQQQKQTLIATESQLKARTQPIIGGFARAGIGQPNPFNFFDTKTSDFYRVGLSISWTPWDWKQSKRQRNILQYNQKLIDAEEENFLQQLDREKTTLLAKVAELEQTLELDAEILALQTEITQSQANQFEQGVVSSTDYVSALNEKTRAELNISLHTIELTKAKIDVLTLTGNLP